MVTIKTISEEVRGPVPDEMAWPCARARGGAMEAANMDTLLTSWLGEAKKAMIYQSEFSWLQVKENIIQMILTEEENSGD